MIAKSVEEAREALEEIVGAIRDSGPPVILTADGEPVAAIVSIADYEWMEAMEDRWLSRLVDEARSAPDYDPADRVPADEFFRQLREDEGRADAAE